MPRGIARQLRRMSGIPFSLGALPRGQTGKSGSLALGFKIISQVGKPKCENEQEGALEAYWLSATHKGPVSKWPAVMRVSQLGKCRDSLGKRHCGGTV